MTPPVPRPLARIALVVALVLAGAAALVAPAGADPVAAAPPPPVADPRLSTALDGVAVSSPAYDRASRQYASDWSSQLEAQGRQSAASTLLAQLATQQAGLEADLQAAVARHDQAQARVIEIKASVQTMAVALFVQGGPDPSGLSVFDPAQGEQVQTAQALVETVSQGRLADLTTLQAVVASTHAQAGRDLAGLDDVSHRQQAATAELAQAGRQLASATAAVAHDQTQVADTRLTASVTGTDLSLVVLDAYWKAAAAMAVRQPTCQITWPVLAGIGRVESANGTFGGDQVSASGEEATPIIGIALDGTNGTQRIPATDGGALTGDPVYDHAVGPMQVLPSAWSRYGQDGNGDGKADPQNMYDAALTAAVMLCRYGPLNTDAGLSTTFFHYNPSQAYVTEVLGYTHAYAAALTI